MRPRTLQVLVQRFFSENEMEIVLRLLCFLAADLSTASGTGQDNPLVSSVSISGAILKQVTESKGEVTVLTGAQYNYTDTAVTKQIGEQLNVSGCITVDWETFKKVRTFAFCTL